MRKIIGFCLGMLLFITGLVVVKNVQAVGCMVVECPGSGDPYIDPITGQTLKTPTTWCTGNCGGVDNGGCPPNTHVLPNGECRTNGSGGSTGGWWVGDDMGGGSCGSGYRADYSQPTRTFCGWEYKDLNIGTGDARQISGCCRGGYETECEEKCDNRGRCRTQCYEGNFICGDPQYTEYACVPICSSSAPSAPTLTYPSNASSQSSTTASLMWNQVSSWGTACSGASNQYYVYLGTTNPPSYFTTVASNVTSINAGGLTRGSTYYWQIVASNGALSSSSAVRSFTILNNQIAGTVFYDTANNCGGAGWSTGGVAVSLNGGAGTAISGTGTFSIAEPLSGPHTLAVSIPAGFICSTAAGCNSCSKAGINLTPAHRLHMSRECLYPRGFV